jgi:hypothetical protein
VLALRLCLDGLQIFAVAAADLTEIRAIAAYARLEGIAPATDRCDDPVLRKLRNPLLGNSQQLREGARGHLIVHANNTVRAALP